jgi:hypothetical protein
MKDMERQHTIGSPEQQPLFGHDTHAAQCVDTAPTLRRDFTDLQYPTNGADPEMARPVLDYYRCFDPHVEFTSGSDELSEPGYFRFGSDAICYGRAKRGFCTNRADAELYDVARDVGITDSRVCLPFAPQEIIENLLHERYTAHFREEGSLSDAVTRKLYYLLRPHLGLRLRTHLQRIHLRNRDKIPFPAWPVDFTVDRLQQRLLALMMRAAGMDAIPFIWFWPDGFSSCAIVTHDVEHIAGKQFCPHLMDIDESFGFKSSFQVIPEERYPMEPAFLENIRDRGFEINVHDLKHDGRLYAERDEFLRRAQQINQYARDYKAEGFRSGILYRNADWYDAFEFSYDMSIPNVGHMDPQHGGCCTVMPYFIGKVVELPLTCTQDHTLFNIMDDYSISLWKRQIGLIRENYGLITVLSHPDYLLTSRAQAVYKDLLGYLLQLKEEDAVWTPLPREVAAWWRQRSEMRLVSEHGTWKVEGPGKERASVAFARIAEDGVAYSFLGDTTGQSPVSSGSGVHELHPLRG